MRWLLLIIFLCAFTPIYVEYSEPNNIREEFRNVENDLQSQQFTVVQSTPFLTDLKDGQIVIVSSGTIARIMYRVNQEIYSVNGSCVTVRR